MWKYWKYYWCLMYSNLTLTLRVEVLEVMEDVLVWYGWFRCLM